MELNPQAAELNNALKAQNENVYDLLSEKGKSIFFPKSGILSQSAEAKGKDINATIGIALEEDATPMRLNSIASKIELDPKDYFPYAPSYGRPDIRAKWKEMIKEKNPSVSDNYSLPVVTNALTHGLSITGFMFVDPEDRLIMPDTFWGNYKLIFQNWHGGVIDTFPAFDKGSFNLEAFKGKLTEDSGKKIVILNFPNNPSGYTPTDEEAEKIKEIILEVAESRDKIVVICDDAYFGLVFEDGIYRESIFTKLADLHENILAVKIDGPTKEDYVWGFRTGFITFSAKGMNDYDSLESKAAGAIRGNISNAANISQSLLMQAYGSGSYEAEKKEKFNLMKKRYDEVKRVLAKHEEFSEVFEPLPFNSGYFMCIQLKNLDGECVRKRLLEKYSTGVIAIGNILRIAFSACPTDKIEQLFANIYDACKEA